MAATLLKTPRKRETGKISMFLKCSTAMENKTVFCPIPQGFPEGERHQPEGPRPLLHPAGASITRPDIHHHQSHTRRNSRPPPRQQHPESPAGSRRLWPGHRHGGGGKEGPIHPLADKKQCQAEFRRLVVKRPNIGTLLEIRKGKKVNCVPRFPAPGCKSVSQGSSEKPHC